MKYKARILIIVENLSVPYDKRVWQEATTLTEAGYKVSIICPIGKDYTKTYEVINNISIYRHPLPVEGSSSLSYFIEYSSALFWELLLTFKVYFREGFDVIQACNPPDLIFLIGGLFKIFGKKFIFDHHDINPELYYAKFKRKDIFYKLMLFFEKLTFKFSDISIATNESFRKIAIERGDMPEDKVFVVRNGPCLERFKIQEPENKLKKGKKYMVGYLGIIGRQDGLDYLLDAARYIRHALGRDDIHYAILGDGYHLERLKEKCNEYKLKDIFEFTGMVQDNTILSYLNTANVCVSPDEYNEMNDKSTMNKILEYMALKKPIVLFDLKEGRYSARDAALYARRNDPVDLANKILTLLDNPKLSQEMGENGKTRIDNELKWDITKQNLLKAYDYLFKQN